MLSINPAKKPPPNENDDEQATITVASIKNCIKLEKDTDRSFKALPKAALCDKEAISQLKGIIYEIIQNMKIFRISNLNGFSLDNSKIPKSYNK